MAKKIMVVCTTDSMIWNFLIPHIKYLILEGYQVECACSRTGSYYDELVKKEGFTLWNLPFHRSPYALDNYKSYRMLKKILRERDINIVYCHEPVGGTIGRLAGHKVGCKVVYMAHGFHFYKGAPKINWLIYYNIEKYLSNYTDLLLTINREDYDASLKFNAKRKELINGIGVDINKYKRYASSYLRDTYSLSKDDLILLTVGELIPRKNHRTIIKAISNLHNNNVHLFIAGEGELLTELIKLSNDLGITEQIHFLGFCRNIPDLCNSCDIFIFPSIHEGLSKAVMEAMACGKPIIASNIRGNNDLIINFNGGLLVNTNNVICYSQAITTLEKSKELRMNYGNYNLNKIKKFDIQIIKKQVLDLIEGVLL